MRFGWKRRHPDASRFAQYGVPRLSRDARSDLAATYTIEMRDVSAILLKHDLIHIGYCEDEYDLEARTIVARLVTFDGIPNVEDVTTIAHEEFIAWFSPEDAGSRERFIPVAQEIRAYWLETQARRDAQTYSNPA